MNNNCNNWALSECCGSSIKWGDICTSCLYHCDNECVNCDDSEECEVKQENI